jgi:hypothetical protein
MLKHFDGFISRDISKEPFRAYMYPYGEEYIIDKPMTLLLKESDTDSHRVIDAQGMCHVIRKDWLAICFPEHALEF